MKTIFGIIMLWPYALFIGPYMVFTYPFSLMTKIEFGAILFLAFVCLLMGIAKRKIKLGKALFAAGIVLWSFVGWIGIGTGT